MPLPYTAEDWDKEAAMAKLKGKKVMIGASCEKCYLEISPSEAAEGQCQCGERITLIELTVAHGLEMIPFFISDVDIKDKVG